MYLNLLDKLFFWFPFILYLWIRIHGPKWMRIHITGFMVFRIGPTAKVMLLAEHLGPRRYSIKSTVTATEIYINEKRL